MSRELMSNGRGNQSNNKARQSYMSEPNVKEFNKGLREHSLTKIGRPYAFSSLEQLKDDLSEYFNLCEKTDTVPTITAIALWLGVNRDTIYAHAHNPNSPFSETLKNVINYCHITMENGTIAGKINPVTFIFLAKNYFGLEDSKNITVTPTTGDNTINNQATMSALQKQLEEENVPNATFKESE